MQNICLSNLFCTVLAILTIMNLKELSSSTKPHADGKLGKVFNPQNISGASQQNRVVAFS